MKHDERLVLIILVLMIIVGAFYWFELRPSQIRKECAVESKSSFGIIVKPDYEDCLKKRGLER